jgi:hypothetical protein
MSAEELEVEEWVDSLPTAAAEARRHASEAHTRAAVAGAGRLRQLAAAARVASECVSE